MKLNPQQAPLYGECLLTVQLCDEDRFEDEEDVEFYLLFSGTTQRHLTSTLRISHVTLQAICPAHDCCESVRVTLCLAKPGRPVDAVAEEGLQFVQDLAFDMAQFLVSTAGQDDGLEGAMLLDECQIPVRECERLDESLALALRHLTLPQGWSVLGTNLGKDTAPAPQETLLHFAARRGLRRVAVFLLQQPGGREALRVPDKQGAIPASVAKRKGHRHLQQLLTPEEIAPWTTTVPSPKASEGRVVRHHPKLNTYTLSVATTPGSPPPSLQEDVEELRQLIRRHSEKKGAPSTQPQTELQETGQECGDSLGTVTVRAGLDRLQQDCLHIAEQRPEEEEARHVDRPSQTGPGGGSPDLSSPSCEERQQEADTAEALISAAQGPAETARKERGGAGGETAAQTAGMGHAQSQERPEEEEGRGRAQEAEQDGEKAPEAPSDGERERGSESERALSRTVLAQSGREDGREMQDVEAGPERPCDADPRPIPRETEPKTDSETKRDCSRENEGDGSEENSTEAPQGGQVDCGEPHSGAVAETGNQEGSSVDVDSPEPDTAPPADDRTACTPQDSVEPKEEKPTPSMEESAVDTCQQESQSSAVHLEYTEPSATKNDITSSSCPQEAGSLEEGAGRGDVSSEELAPSIEEDPLLSISSSMAEPFPLPEVSTVTPPTQEVNSLEEEKIAVPSQMDESITHSDSASHSEGTSQAQQEEEGGAAGIPSSTEPNLPSSANEDVTGVLQQESSPGLPQEEPKSDGFARALEGQGELTQEGEEPELKQETQDTALESNGSDTEPATPSCPQEAVIHIEEPPLPETHIEEKEEEEEENDRALEEKGDGRSTPEPSPEIPESGVTAETASVNGGDLGPESLPEAPEQSTEDTPEQAAVTPSLEAAVEERTENTDGKLAAGEVIDSSAGRDDSTEDDVTVLVSGLETTQEEPDLRSPTAPVNCDPVTPDLAGVISPKDLTRNLTPALERVEEESEESGE
ncbi:hypothetical protein ANANG_G00106570 [Anguilla anguilla]|uniref:DBB domain-containing protein n=1 Tax=Anguilla anguilla TaxID=7936 RepID=A0A9D3MMQ8_ANGAN|nr:hypothetical protein ANANG_G00106570 [Anguilla anguilla]